jgi:phosphopantetheinyl transferase
MFRYVLVQASEHPSLAAGQAWPGLLSPREEAILARMTFLPRRRKWLIGRVAAKRLVREMPELHGVTESSISVLNHPSGEPFVLIEGKADWQSAISISHRREVGMAAVPAKLGARIGADVEIIEPRDPAMVRQFFTDSEAKILAGSGDDRDEVVARIWSAKEAVLKLLGLGLRLDTRAIEVKLAGEPIAHCPVGWQPIEVNVREGLAEVSPPNSLRTVWCREGGHVLTVAVSQ